MWILSTLSMEKPLYLAVAEVLERDIRNGVLKAGDRLPTHRELAKQVGVTLSTATRVYKEAEKRGLVTAVVGRGTFVTSDCGRKPRVIDVEEKSLSLDLGMARPLPLSDPEILPVARRIFQRKRLAELMAYSDPQGLPEHRAIGSDWVSRFGIAVPPKEIVITAGAQHALFMVCNSLFCPGDRIATDALTYPGFKAAAQRNGLRLEGVEMDCDGMLPDELDNLCNRHLVKGVYISGRIQVPTNREMPETRRLELRSVIRRHGLILIENDPFGFLNPTRTSTLSALIPESSVYISGLSKAFLAGLRIAFVAAPAALIKPLTQGIADNMLAVSPLCAALAAECIATGIADTAITRRREALARRLTLFRKIFTGHYFAGSGRSPLVWLALPPRWQGLDIGKEAAKQKIRVFSADKFAVGASQPPVAVCVALTGVEDLATLRGALCSLERLISKAG